MKAKYLTLAICLILPLMSTAQKSPAGDWEASLKIQGIELPLVIHLKQKGDAWEGSFDSPKQKAYNISLTSVSLRADTLEFTHKQAGIRFLGLFQADSIPGNFSQGGKTMPMTLRRQLGAPIKVAETIRPQQPKPPFNYSIREVKIKNKAANLTLAGTLTVPAGKGPFPAVVLISGSGPQDRNSEVFDHQPFAVLAHHLTQAGIAVLRYDDRGVGKSTGDFNAATSEDFAGDALAAWAFLRKQKGINKNKVGLIGHSEGGMVAPIAFARQPEPAFVVLMAGVGIPVTALLAEQIQAVGQSEGLSQAAIDSQLSTNARTFHWLKTLPATQARDSLQAYLAAQKALLPANDAAAREQFENQAAGALRTYLDPWFLYFIGYDPRPNLMKLSCPVLAINGDKDVQVLAASNLQGIEAALKAGGNKNYKICSLPGLNHLFQPAKTGAVSEYATIDTTFDPAAMEVIASWIKGLK